LYLPLLKFVTSDVPAVRPVISNDMISATVVQVGVPVVPVLIESAEPSPLVASSDMNKNSPVGLVAPLTPGARRSCEDLYDIGIH
jgi:hypothetical protein